MYMEKVVVYRAEISPDILALLKPDAVARRQSLTARINSILFDYVTGKRTLGLEDLRPKPKRVYVRDIKHAKEMDERHKYNVAVFADKWKGHSVEDIATYMHIKLRQYTREIIETLHPGADTYNYLIPDTDDVRPHLWENTHETYPDFMAKRRRLMEEDGYDQGYIEDFLLSAHREYCNEVWAKDIEGMREFRP